MSKYQRVDIPNDINHESSDHPWEFSIPNGFLAHMFGPWGAWTWRREKRCSKSTRHSLYLYRKPCRNPRRKKLFQYLFGCPELFIKLWLILSQHIWGYSLKEVLPPPGGLACTSWAKATALGCLAATEFQTYRDLGETLAVSPVEQLAIHILRKKWGPQETGERQPLQIWILR